MHGRHGQVATPLREATTSLPCLSCARRRTTARRYQPRPRRFTSATWRYQTMTSPQSPMDGAWALIENEKRRDRFVRRVSVIAWSTALLIALLVVVMAGISATQTARL